MKIVDNNTTSQQSSNNNNPAQEAPVTTEVSGNQVPTSEAGGNTNIATDPLVKCLMLSVITGWQTYAMARSMFDELPMYTAEEKEAYFKKVAQESITDANGNMVAFKPVNTIVALEKAVLPFWQMKLKAAREAKEAAGQKDNQTGTGAV